MRILLNALQSGNRSGTGRYTLELARAFQSLSTEATIDCFWPDGSIRSSKDHPSSLPEESMPPFRRFLKEQWSLPRLVKKKAYDLLHYPVGTGLLFSPARHVLTIHDLCYMRNPDWFPKSRVHYYRMLMGNNARKAARIFADSEATARDVEELLRIPSDRIDVIPLGVDRNFQPASTQDRESLRARLELPKDFFLFVGTLEPRKNLLTLIRAWARLPLELPDLVLAGRVGWKLSREELSSLAGHKSDRLHFLDHVPGDLLPALYSEARAFVYPSFMEGFGLPPLEAMACGTPVITSNTSSLPEVTGDAAILVSPTKEEELAGALEWLAGNDSLHEKLREKGLNRAAQFSWEKTAALSLAGYKKALEDR